MTDPVGNGNRNCRFLGQIFNILEVFRCRKTSTGLANKVKSAAIASETTSQRETPKAMAASASGLSGNVKPKRRRSHRMKPDALFLSRRRIEAFVRRSHARCDKLGQGGSQVASFSDTELFGNLAGGERTIYELA